MHKSQLQEIREKAVECKQRDNYAQYLKNQMKGGKGKESTATETVYFHQDLEPDFR